MTLHFLSCWMSPDFEGYFDNKPPVHSSRSYLFFLFFCGISGNDFLFWLLKRRYCAYKFFQQRVKEFSLKKRNLVSRFDNVFFRLLVDFKGNRAGKCSSWPGKVLNAAYTNRNFLLLLWSAIKVYICEKYCIRGNSSRSSKFNAQFWSSWLYFSSYEVSTVIPPYQHANVTYMKVHQSPEEAKTNWAI